MNDPKVRTISLPSLGGIGTAGALARFYPELSKIGVSGNRKAQI
jgi:hypothetical protein